MTALLMTDVYDSREDRANVTMYEDEIMKEMAEVSKLQGSMDELTGQNNFEARHELQKQLYDKRTTMSSPLEFLRGLICQAADSAKVEATRLNDEATAYDDMIAKVTSQINDVEQQRSSVEEDSDSDCDTGDDDTVAAPTPTQYGIDELAKDLNMKNKILKEARRQRAKAVSDPASQGEHMPTAASYMSVWRDCQRSMLAHSQAKDALRLHASQPADHKSVVPTWVLCSKNITKQLSKHRGALRAESCEMSSIEESSGDEQSEDDTTISTVDSQETIPYEEDARPGQQVFREDQIALQRH